jgi:hypothetical protein
MNFVPNLQLFQPIHGGIKYWNEKFIWKNVCVNFLNFEAYRYCFSSDCRFSSHILRRRTVERNHREPPAGVGNPWSAPEDMATKSTIALEKQYRYASKFKKITHTFFQINFSFQYFIPPWIGWNNCKFGTKFIQK